MQRKNIPSIQSPKKPTTKMPLHGRIHPSNKNGDGSNNPTRGSTTVSPNDPGGYPPRTGKDRK